MQGSCVNSIDLATHCQKLAEAHCQALCDLNFKSVVACAVRDAKGLRNSLVRMASHICTFCE